MPAHTASGEGARAPSAAMRFAGDLRFRGHYFRSSTTNAFQPCGEPERYWVAAPPDVLASLIDLAYEEPRFPATLYVEFMGHVLDEADLGQPVDYAGAIGISALVTFEIASANACG